MSFRIPRPKNTLEIFAGLVGLAFDRIIGPSRVRVIMPDEPDDLTKINGIGDTFARRLKAAGIVSYAQLAVLTPEQAQKITKAAVWQADPIAWIEQARALA